MCSIYSTTRNLQPKLLEISENLTKEKILESCKYCPLISIRPCKKKKRKHEEEEKEEEEREREEEEDEKSKVCHFYVLAKLGQNCFPLIHECLLPVSLTGRVRLLASLLGCFPQCRVFQSFLPEIELLLIGAPC